MGPEKAPDSFVNTSPTGPRTIACAARAFAQKVDLERPLLVDTIDDELENRHELRPDRLYVIKGGKVLWRGGVGPLDYDEIQNTRHLLNIDRTYIHIHSRC